MKAYNILELIGNTPHLKLNNLFNSEAEVWIKIEKNNPGSSIKDRIALSMIEEAEKNGALKPGGIIIEASSGNTGIALAMVATVKNYRLILVMPSSVSAERQKVMKAYGAEIELTAPDQGMKGAIEKAREIAALHEDSWMPGQFNNDANIAAHIEFTSQEIINDFPDGIDYLFAGVGSGGHISGCARELKETFPNLKVYAIEPEQSAVLSGGDAGPHIIQGIGAGFIPEQLDIDLIDGIIKIPDRDALNFTRLLARKEGLMAGISTGANIAAVFRKIKDFKPGEKILTFCYDTGDRYLSVNNLY